MPKSGTSALLYITSAGGSGTQRSGKSADFGLFLLGARRTSASETRETKKKKKW